MRFFVENRLPHTNTDGSVFRVSSSKLVKSIRDTVKRCDDEGVFVYGDVVERILNSARIPQRHALVENCVRIDDDDSEVDAVT